MRVIEMWIGHQYSQEDNLKEIDADVLVKYENGNIYSFTVETPRTLEKCMIESGQSYYWITDLIVVKELLPEYIKEALESIDEELIDKVGQLSDRDRNETKEIELEVHSNYGTYYKY